MKKNKSVINVKNNDNKCFLYSTLASRQEILSHPEHVSQYEILMTELQWKDTDFPMAINMIPYFEKKNNIKVNVYAIEEDSLTSKISPHRIELQNKEEINPFLHDKVGNKSTCVSIVLEIQKLSMLQKTPGKLS